MTSTCTLNAPFPWFGGKSRVANLVWERFGKLDNYVEPFFGSGAVLLNSPRTHRTETINDLDGFVANFWRAVALAPDEVAEHCDWPSNENDLHARHSWIVAQRGSLTRRLEGAPDFFDAKIAGWWVWGIGLWIGSGFASGKGPWQVVDGQLLHLGNAGRGVHRQLLHLGDAGRGVHRQLLHLGNAGRGVHRQRLLDWFGELSERLYRVRVCCGDWSRVCSPTPTVKQGLTGLFLDPPYSDDAGRCDELYANDSLTVAHDVRDWCIERGDDPRIRVALCGYVGEHDMPTTWDCVEWKAQGGYASESKQHDNENARRERIWFSPHCLRGSQGELFGEVR